MKRSSMRVKTVTVSERNRARGKERSGTIIAVLPGETDCTRISAACCRALPRVEGGKGEDS